MPVNVGISFPSESVALQRHLQSEKDLTPTERLLAADDLFAAVEILSQAGGLREAELTRRSQLEAEWRRRISEFIEKHAAPN